MRHILANSDNRLLWLRDDVTKNGGMGRNSGPILLFHLSPNFCFLFFCSFRLTESAEKVTDVEVSDLRVYRRNRDRKW